uniref:EMAP like 2 n=1 Tax=Sphenodon punctatus TaxID=8508 RepID=A0A8D0H1R4_SPHPU
MGTSVGGEWGCILGRRMRIHPHSLWVHTLCCSHRAPQPMNTQCGGRAWLGGTSLRRAYGHKIPMSGPAGCSRLEQGEPALLVSIPSSPSNFLGGPLGREELPALVSPTCNGAGKLEGACLHILGRHGSWAGHGEVALIGCRQPSRSLFLDVPPASPSYGYRGRDCRANLFLLPTGEIVYFVAAVAVLYSVEEQRQRHYLGHTDDIKCLAVHPDMVTIATGQVAGTSKDGKSMPPHVRVWDSVSLNTLHVLGPGPFDRAVSCVGFLKSNGGGLLCAVDDSNDHVLSVWDWQKEQKVADVKKHEKPKYVLCVAFTENGDTVTGDSGGNLYIWGKGGNRISHAVPGAHEGGVFGLCVLRNGTIVSGGGRDRRVVLWGRDYQKLQENEVPESFGPVRTIAEGKGDTLFVGTTRNSVLQGSLMTGFTLLVQGHTEELWGLATHPSLDQFVTCGQDKQVHLWSVAAHQPLWSKGIEDAARSAGFHPHGSVLAVGTVTGRWLVLDTETRDLVTIHTDGNEPISVVSFSPDGSYLALGSHDNFFYVYVVSEGGKKYGRVGRCSGHSSFITHLDWASDSSCFVTNSGDYEILYWDPSSCRQITSAEAVRSIDWATATCVLGFGVFGIWPEGADGTDINAVCRSHDGKLLASADDFGKVHLFSYPCCQPRAPSHTYGGHSSHVTNIAFLHGDSLLLSTGGTDTSVLQWRLR